MHTKAKFKCEDCDFMGENDESMFVHFGKVHSEKFECGICECEMDTLENLEVHLVT